MTGAMQEVYCGLQSSVQGLASSQLAACLRIHNHSRICVGDGTHFSTFLLTVCVCVSVFYPNQSKKKERALGACLRVAAAGVPCRGHQRHDGVGSARAGDVREHSHIRGSRRGGAFKRLRDFVRDALEGNGHGNLHFFQLTNQVFVLDFRDEIRHCKRLIGQPGADNIAQLEHESPGPVALDGLGTNHAVRVPSLHALSLWAHPDGGGVKLSVIVEC